MHSAIVRHVAFVEYRLPIKKVLGSSGTMTQSVSHTPGAGGGGGGGGTGGGGGGGGNSIQLGRGEKLMTLSCPALAFIKSTTWGVMRSMIVGAKIREHHAELANKNAVPWKISLLRCVACGHKKGAASVRCACQKITPLPRSLLTVAPQ